ncbi:MAG: PSD1 and planctomycete cytochrome C domain-containing protein [Opitutales bacterium]
MRFPFLILPLISGIVYAETKVDFAREVLPVLSNKCFVCHGPDSKKKDVLRLDSREGATRDLGGYRAIDADSPEESEILARLHDADDPMPPEKAEKKLTKAEREILSLWVKQGGEYAKHWAFVKPVRPNAKGSAIDYFVEKKLESVGKGFAPEAERAVLARRVALTLTGLPPEPKRLSNFLKDKRGDAYERFVDELLASPRFGEHQARYWLDAVRYGDTHGLHLDNKRGIYPYRDWVVRSFNDNLPLDDFLVWQLAGDLLPEPTLAQRVATGFVRMNPSTAEGGAIPAEFQAKNNFDRVENLGTSLLGLSLVCARCHTHKYDPVTQTEYYRLLAFFNSTAEASMDGNKYEYAPNVRVPSDQTTWKQWKELKKKRTDFLVEANKTETDTHQRWLKANEEERMKILTEPDAKSSELRKRATEVAKAIAEAEKKFTTTLVARELAKPRVTKLLDRGEYDMPVGEPLLPGIPAFLGVLPKGEPRNRLGLARWLVSREHPLVARVLVNRIWQRVFGAGLVRTPADFGLQGEQPTHPELLDWLAVELQEEGWNLKKMLRLLVTSRTFKQSSEHRANLSDLENRLFGRGPSYRLDAEVLRDLSLWSSSLLDSSMGGEGVKPYQPPGLWKELMHPGSNTKNYVADKGDRLYRRSLYVYWKRTSPHPMMTLFDAPSREASCVRRSRTNTPLQSLALFNEPQRIEAARKLAERLLREADNDDARLDLLFILTASRPPKDIERSACSKLLQAQRTRYASTESEAQALLAIGNAPRDVKLKPVEVAAWTQVASTVLASDLAILLY